MKRRTFIITTAGAIAAVSIPAYYYLSDAGYDTTFAQPESLSLIWDAQAINAIGNQYRSDVPSEKSQRSLVKLLNETPPTTLNEKISDDFKRGNIALVDGWILSVTEARQCALASTVQSK